MTSRFSMIKIRLVGAEDNKQKGFSILLHSGSVVYTKKYEYIVPEESIRKLEENGICFEQINN